METGTFIAVNGSVLGYHFLVALGGDDYMDVDDRKVYRINPREVELALKTPTTAAGRHVLEPVKVLPDDVFGVVKANALMDTISELHFFKPGFNTGASIA